MTAHFIFWSKFEGSVNWLNPVSIKFPIPIFQEQGYTGQGLDQTLDRAKPRTEPSLTNMDRTREQRKVDRKILNLKKMILNYSRLNSFGTSII